MTIIELYQEIQKSIKDTDYYGEFTLCKNQITWTYNLKNVFKDESDNDYMDEEESYYTTISDNYDILQDSYTEDKEKIEILLDEFDEYENFKFSDPKYSNEIISFKILKKI